MKINHLLKNLNVGVSLFILYCSSTALAGNSLSESTGDGNPEAHDISYSLHEEAIAGDVDAFIADFRFRRKTLGQLYLRQHPGTLSEQDKEQFRRQILIGRDAKGKTVLAYAIMFGRTEIAHLIIRHLTPEDLISPSGFSDLNYLQAAVAAKNLNIMKFILAKLSPEEINSQNKAGKTALIIAVDQGFTKGVALLASKLSIKGINTPDSTAKTAMDYAIKNGNEDILKILHRYLQINYSNEKCKLDESHKITEGVIKVLDGALEKFKTQAQSVLNADPKHLNTALLNYVQENKESLSKDSGFTIRTEHYIQNGIHHAGGNLECQVAKQHTPVKQLEELIQCFKDKTDEKILFTTWGDQATSERGQFNSYIDLMTILIDPELSFVDTKKLPPFPDPNDKHTALIGVISKTIGAASILNGTLTRIKAASAGDNCSFGENIEVLRPILMHIAEILPKYVAQAQKLKINGPKGDDGHLLHDIQVVTSAIEEIKEACTKAEDVIRRHFKNR